MAKAILTLATTILLALAGLAAAQPNAPMAPGSGSSPGTGATGPGYEVKGDRPGSGSTGHQGDEPRGSIGAGRMEPGGSVARTTSSSTVPRP